MVRMRAVRWQLRLGSLWLLGLATACPECAPGSANLDFNCSSDVDCTTGYRCVEGLCTRSSVLVDASAVDQSTPDARVADQAAPDTAVEDAAIADSGGSDLAVPDAPALDVEADAGSSDVALSDVPGQDAASPDGAPLDAGPSDASMVDGTQVDATEADAADVDATVVDAAVVDATAIDVALDDAAMEDAAVQDAALDDAASASDAASCGPATSSSPWTLLPVMTRRQTGGPFGVAPLLQGAVVPGVCVAGDAIGVMRGDYLGGSFHTHFDPTQGSLVAWVTPEWSIAEVLDDSRTFLAAGDFVFGVDGSSQGAFLQLGATRLSFPGVFGDWQAGTTHLVVLRWDHRHPIEGGEAALSVDGRAPVVAGGAITVSQVAQNLVVGAADLSGRGSLGALLEGLTIYRRPLASPGGGVNVGRDDEVGAIFAAGAGTEPTLITGSWDVVLALPGNAEDGELPPDAQAFSHPHGANLLGTAGYLLGEAAHRAWTPTAASPAIVHTAAAAPADWIYRGSLRVTTQEQRQGLSRAVDVSGLTSVVVRAVTHSGANTAALLRVTDAAGNALAELSGTPEATREHPDVLLVTAAVPAGPTPTILHVQLLNRGAAGTSFVLHQVEVLPNLLRNPSFETGSGVPWVPTSWTDEYPATNTTWQEITQVHSGASALGLSAPQTTVDFHQIIQTPQSFGRLGHFYATGAHFWWKGGTRPLISVQNGCFFSLAAPSAGGGKFDAAGVTTSDTWQHVQGVGRRLATATDAGRNCWNNILRFGGTWAAAANMLLDDAYVIDLEQVDLHPLPADLEHSYESGLVRADGEDTLSMPISGLTASSGQIALRVGLDHPVALYQDFCPYDAVLWQAWGDANNHITLRFNYDPSTRHGIRIDANFGGPNSSGAHFDYVVLDIDLDDRVARPLVLRYQTGGSIELLVDGIVRLSQPMNSRQFTLVPTTLYAGVNAGGWDFCDVRVDVDGAAISAP